MDVKTLRFPPQPEVPIEQQRREGAPLSISSRKLPPRPSVIEKRRTRHRSISEIVNERRCGCHCRKTAGDLAAFEDRVAEPILSYEALLKDLKAHGKL